MKRNRFYAKRKVAMRDASRKYWKRQERIAKFWALYRESITEAFMTPTPFWEYLKEKQWVS